MDCDAEIREYPTLFDDIPTDFDLAAHILDRSAWYGSSDMGTELLSGTLFVRNTPNVRNLLDVWIKRCETSTTWEQRILQSLISEFKIKIYELPIEYCYIKSLPDGSPPKVKCEKPVIVHNQVSRQYRTKV